MKVLFDWQSMEKQNCLFIKLDGISNRDRQHVQTNITYGGPSVFDQVLQSDRGSLVWFTSMLLLLLSLCDEFQQKRNKAIPFLNLNSFFCTSFIINFVGEHNQSKIRGETSSRLLSIPNLSQFTLCSTNEFCVATLRLIENLDQSLTIVLEV